MTELNYKVIDAMTNFWTIGFKDILPVPEKFLNIVIHHMKDI